MIEDGALLFFISVHVVCEEIVLLFLFYFYNIVIYKEQNKTNRQANNTQKLLVFVCRQMA